MIAASYYDGRTARRYAVNLSIEDGVVRIAGDGIERSATLAELKISEPMGKAPRLLAFPDGAVCEVRDDAALQPLLAAHGHRDSAVVGWQYRRMWIAAALLLNVLLVAAGYFLGLPRLAEYMAARVPDVVVDRISDQTLAMLDGTILQPSKLPTARQAALDARFQRMLTPDGDTIDHRIIFGASRALGANALALPSGTIVVTDDLVRLAGNDEEIMGVLAHELGHVHGRHGLRLVLESSVVGLITAWYVGDVSTLLAGAPAALLQARYSRDLESEADAYAARMLRANGIAPSRLADMLERLAGDEAKHRGSGDKSSWEEYLSSHPATRERIDALRRAAVT